MYFSKKHKFSLFSPNTGQGREGINWSVHAVRSPLFFVFFLKNYFWGFSREALSFFRLFLRFPTLRGFYFGVFRGFSVRDLFRFCQNLKNNGVANFAFAKSTCTYTNLFEKHSLGAVAVSQKSTSNTSRKSSVSLLCALSFLPKQAVISKFELMLAVEGRDSLFGPRSSVF